MLGDRHEKTQRKEEAGSDGHGAPDGLMLHAV